MMGLRFLELMETQWNRPYGFRGIVLRLYSKRGVKRMPAKSKAQLRAAYAAKARGEKWGEEMVEKTHSTKGLPEKVKKKGKRK